MVVSEEQKVPQSKEEADELIARLAEIEIALGKCEAEFNQEVNALRSAQEVATKSLKDEHEEIRERLRSFAQAHRRALTLNGRTKTVKFPHGKIAWRFSTPSLAIMDKDRVLAALKRLRGGKHHIRVVESINRQSLKGDADMLAKLDDVRLVSTEGLYVKPQGIEKQIRLG